MYLRNYKGKLVLLDENKYSNERELYIKIWKIRFNIDIAKSIDNTNILEYVNGEKFSV
tara:strand:+ start:302 stop:475 length:174 start_codon:yes stop_codon:yes gene_type:complete